jgi:hypothetical protein
LSAVRHITLDPAYHRLIAASGAGEVKAWDLSRLGAANLGNACLLDYQLAAAATSVAATHNLVLVGDATGRVLLLEPAATTSASAAGGSKAAVPGAAGCVVGRMVGEDAAHAGPVAGVAACEWLECNTSCGPDGFIKVRGVTIIFITNCG